MLELKNITKIYKTAGFTQKALDGVSVNFRKNEFASILGPSGSGKTTLLNIIGGLDHYDSGNLIINETSTKKYKDRDWDSYRNHRIGFVFQSYNLISHQTILTNVELALTLSGVSKKERLERAKDALIKVGLEKHIHKKPTELSGGQMQRVAIARALVNNPEILLADEPTGALDSTTSVQIMKLLKDIAKDRLVIMVTHNPDLAEEYSTRIIKLKDGKIIDDSNPYDGKVNTNLDIEEKYVKTARTSMNFLTALLLSLNNLMTKKGRTILTAFAGSIGIIGIALILSLSTGVNNYINDIQKETLVSYPISIEEETMDYTSIMQDGMNTSKDVKKKNKDGNVYGNNDSLVMKNSVSNNTTKNNLGKFKKYLDNKNSGINKYLGDNGIVYSYNPKFSVYSYDDNNNLINTDGSTFEAKDVTTTSSSNGVSTSFTMSRDNIFSEMMSDNNGNISNAVKSEYKLVSGSWPKEYNDVVIILDKNNEISTTSLYYLGYLPGDQYKDILNKIKNNEKLKLDTKKIKYEDMLNKEFTLLTESDFYIKNNNNLFENVKDSEGKVEELVKTKGTLLKVVGIIRVKNDAKSTLIAGEVGYTKALTNYIISHTNDSEVVTDQLNSKDKSVVTGLRFNTVSDDEKMEDAKNYIKSLKVSEKAKVANSIFKELTKNNKMMEQQILDMGEEDLANSLDMFLLNPDKEVLVMIYDNYIDNLSYDDTLDSFGFIDKSSPSRIDIYTDTFEDKDAVSKVIEDYNKKVKKKDKIVYTDYVKLLMSSVTTIVNAISYVLIAFVSISLIVSSIMIAIITYISVLERTKEIGILRAIGASKKDITRVFNAETFIEGFIAGCLGIFVTVMLSIPINSIISKITDVEKVAILPIKGAIILILISVVLTVIAGLVPSRMASKKDPVTSLRTE